MFKIAHIALSVSDLDRSVNFYKRNFGFKCIERFQIKPLKLKIALLKRNNVALELFEFEGYKPLPRYRRDVDTDLKTLGTKHFALAVPDIEKTYRELSKNRVKFATDIQIFNNGLRYLFIRDPDGILIEIIESKIGG